MSVDTVQNLFDYGKKSSQSIQGKNGARIGLILAKEFLDKNNAAIEVVSEIDKGTKFRNVI